VDATQEDIAGAYKTIRAELKAYGHGLDEKPEVVALSKCDALTDAEIVKKRKELKKAARKEPFALSSHSGLGVREVLREVFRFVRESRAAEAKPGDAA
jgi:GTP-binding protein